MNISRNFLITAAAYLFVGMMLGMYMGGSGDHSLTAVHAHINLVGFTMMTLFAVVYKVFPRMANGRLARVHFWLHQIGSFTMLSALFLMIGEFVPRSVMGPIMPLTEIILVLALIAFGLNAYRWAK